LECNKLTKGKLAKTGIRDLDSILLGRMVLNGMTSYRTAIEEVGVYREFLHVIVAPGKRRLMTTFFNYQNPEFLGISSCMTYLPVTSIVDNLILMRIVEIDTPPPCISVVTSRQSKHCFDTRDLVIGQEGLSLISLEQSLVSELRLQYYSGLVNRIAIRFAPPKRTRSAAAAQDKE
jgi:hypothetical protein